MAVNRRKTTAEFVADAVARFGDRFDYSRAKYLNTTTPVTIIAIKNRWAAEHGWALVRINQTNVEDALTAAGILPAAA